MGPGNRNFRFSSSKLKKKNSVCTAGTPDGSETSLNTVVHKNIKVYGNYVKFFLKFPKFFQKLPSAHIFINCTNLSKFVKFVTVYIKTRNLSKIKIFDNCEMTFQMAITSQWMIRLL